MEFSKEVKKHQTLNRILVLLLIVIVTSFIYWLNPEPLQKFTQLLVTGDIAGSIDYIRSFGPYAALVSFLLIVFVNAVAVLPNIFILAANGIIFGVWEGTLISWVAEAVGVIISFLLMRYLFHDYAHQLILHNDAMQKVDNFSGKNGFKIMLIARSIPFIPSGLITALGAVSSIRLKDYILATFIGKIPSAWIEVTLGHDITSYREHTFRLTLLILISVFAYMGFLWYKKKN